MSDERNLEARRLIAAQLAAIQTELTTTERRAKSLVTQTRKNDANLVRLDAEIAGLRQALEALGGPPPEDAE